MTPRPGSLRPSSIRKRDAVLDAAAAVFLREGFASASVDVVASASGISKQTIYSHFGSKEGLFVAAVQALTAATADLVHREAPDADTAEDAETYLRRYGDRLLDRVLDPRLLALRRLVIGEVPRFPDLARTFWDAGPATALLSLEQTLTTLASRGLLAVDEPAVAARTFNWLVLAAPLNAAMLLGDAGIPPPAERPRIVRVAVRVVLATWGPGPDA